MSRKQTLYRVSTWDHEHDRWRAYVTRSRKWHLRKIIRTLEGCGYDRQFSILVERRDRHEPAPTPTTTTATGGDA